MGRFVPWDVLSLDVLYVHQLKRDHKTSPGPEKCVMYSLNDRIQTICKNVIFVRSFPLEQKLEIADLGCKSEKHKANANMP